MRFLKNLYEGLASSCVVVVFLFAFQSKVCALRIGIARCYSLFLSTVKWKLLFNRAPLFILICRSVELTYLNTAFVDCIENVN